MNKREMLLRILCILAALAAVIWIAHAIGEEEPEPDYQALYVMHKQYARRFIVNYIIDTEGGIYTGDGFDWPAR